MTTYTAAHTRQLRFRLLARDEISRVRIARNGEVHCYGRMPNTNQTGWYFAGWSDDMIEKMLEDEHHARELERMQAAGIIR